MQICSLVCRLGCTAKKNAKKAHTQTLTRLPFHMKFALMASLCLSVVNFDRYIFHTHTQILQITFLCVFAQLWLGWPGIEAAGVVWVWGFYSLANFYILFNEIALVCVCVCVLAFLHPNNSINILSLSVSPKTRTYKHDLFFVQRGAQFLFFATTLAPQFMYVL